MSKKHHQRTRAEILARRSAMKYGGIHAAAARRAMRSKYKPHQGTKESAKEYVTVVGRNGHDSIRKFTLPF